MNYQEFQQKFPNEQLSELEIAALNEHGNPELLMRDGEPFNIKQAEIETGLTLNNDQLLLPAEVLLKKHKITYGDAPAYGSEVLGLINTLTRLLLVSRNENEKLKNSFLTT